MKKVPKGKLITVGQMREYLAKENNADFTDSMTVGIFVNIVAWASYQRSIDITPYWRTLKSDGELNAKYPEAIELQKFEETGVSNKDIELDHFMDLNYFKYENNIQVYYGILKHKVTLVEEKNKLE